MASQTDTTARPALAAADAGPAPSCRAMVDTLVGVSANLVHLLERETEMLVDMKMPEVAALQDQKKELVRLYALAVRQIRQHAIAVKAALPVVRDEIETALKRVHDVALKNERAIASARKVNEGVMKAIAEVWNADRSAAAGYTRKGLKPQANTKKPGFAYASVAYDERC
jgi:methionyl-tRNA synthetase